MVAISAFGLTGCVVFVTAYHVRSGGRWRFNEVGVWLMLSRINLGLIFALLIIGRFFGPSTLREIFVYVLVALFAAQTFWPSKFIWRPHSYGIARPPREEEERPRDDTRA